MLNDDKISKFILNYRLPVSRGNIPVKQYLESYFSDLLTNLKDVTIRDSECKIRQNCYDLLKSKFSIIETLCKDIITVFEYYDSADVVKLSNHFSKMMEKIKSDLFERNIKSKNNVGFRQYYRLRAGNEEFSREQLFHIPMNCRHLIKSYRYSIPGYPCLYLSTGKELCWFECGMPKEFSFATFELMATDESPVHFIDFSYNPVSFINQVKTMYLTGQYNNSEIDELIARYIICLPLKIACSLEVVNRDVAFIEEYIFPQQLLLWVRNNQVYDGIIYRTCSSVKKASEWSYVNLVMPAKDIATDYCKHLNKKFKVTQPQRMKLSEIIKEQSSHAHNVREFLEYVRPEYYNGIFIYPYKEIISLCETFILLYNMLSNDTYINAEAILQTMETLNSMTYLLLKNRELILENALADNGFQLDGKYKKSEKDTLVDEITNAFLLFEQKVKPAISAFSNYVNNITNASSDDFTSLQYVFEN